MVEQYCSISNEHNMLLAFVSEIVRLVSCYTGHLIISGINIYFISH